MKATSSRNLVVLVLLLFFASLFPPAVGAQTYIFGRADFLVGNAPTAIATGDFNGDGLIDMAVTNSNDHTVSVVLGRPDGTFAPQVTYATGPEPFAVVTGDFNGDGNLDVAVINGNCKTSKTSCGAGTVSILLGNGDGTFQSHIDYAVGTFPTSVAAADFNGDGKLDLAVANARDNTVSVLIGNGDGTFKSQVVYVTAQSSGSQSVVVGDFNGDGKLDLAVSCGSVVSVLLGNGDGTFRTHLDSGAGGIALAAGDFNRDGSLDLAVVTGASGNLEVLLGNGDGTFILNAIYPGGSSVAVGDLSGNGKLDLVVPGAGTNFPSQQSVSVLLGNGDGTFQTPVQYGTGSLPVALVLADFNGDGKLDVAVVDSGCMIPSFSCSGQPTTAGAASILLGFGDGTFVGTTNFSLGIGPASVTSADLNHDGKLDLATANQLANSASVLLGNGDGTFGSPTSYSTAAEPVWVATGDLRNNGIVDLVTANLSPCTGSSCNPGNVSVLLGNGDGTFQPHLEYGAGLEPVSVAAADFRNNGKLDLAVANMYSGSVSVLLGNGDGTFQPQVSYVTVPFPKQVAVGDFNHDGNLDLAVAGNGVSILLGNGDGTFRTHVDYGGGQAIAVGDFNGDGRLDLATGGYGSVCILLGNSDGTFQSPVCYSMGMLNTDYDVGYVVIADFNLDGKADLAVTGGRSVVILLGNGDGSFQAPIEYLLAPIAPGSLAVGDFNADGAPDWTTTDGDNNTVDVMLSAAFKAISPSSQNFGSQGVGTTSLSRVIAISNPSNVKLNIASITSSGSFAETNNCGASLTPGTNCAISVTFSPTTTGLQSGAITITDSSRISPLAVPVSGNGVTGSFLSAYPSRHNFSPQMVGTSSSSSPITLANTGNAPLTITSISITGTNGSDFSETNNCLTSLPVSGSCVVAVTFRPGSGGSRTAELAVNDSAPGSPHKVALSGTGVTLGLSSSNASATVTAGNTGSYMLSIGGTGFGGTVTLACSGAPAAAKCSLPASVNVDADTTQTFTVTVSTTAPVTASAGPPNFLPHSSWLWTLALAGIVILPASGRTKLGHYRNSRWLRGLPFLMLLLLVCSCGGSGGSSNCGTCSTGTPAGEYTVTVTAKSGFMSQSLQLTLTVQ